jgi:hypothetical protein
MAIVRSVSVGGIHQILTKCFGYTRGDDGKSSRYIGGININSPGERNKCVETIVGNSSGWTEGLSTNLTSGWTSVSEEFGESYLVNTEALKGNSSGM